MISATNNYGDSPFEGRRCERIPPGQGTQPITLEQGLQNHCSSHFRTRRFAIFSHLQGAGGYLYHGRDAPFEPGRPAQPKSCCWAIRMDFQRVRAAVLMSLSIVSGISSLSAQDKIPRVKLQQAACGALLRDDFNSSKINESLWHLCVEDPGLHVNIENGELLVRGTSAPIPEEVLRQNEAKLWRFAGVCSRPFPQTDVALATRVKLSSGIPAEAGTHAVSVHLCGSRPDTLAEVLFGKLEGKAWKKQSTSTPRVVPMMFRIPTLAAGG
jgi:hypothetical protein